MTRTTPFSLAAIGVLALAACGGSSSDDDSGIASLDDPVEADGEAIDPDLALADYQQCLRDNGAGVDFHAGAGGGSISIGGSGEADPQSGGGFDADAFRQAAEACSDLAEAAIGAFTPDPQQQAEIEDAQLRFDECMSDKGLEGYRGNMATSSGLDIAGSGDASDPQGGNSFDDVDPDVLREALDECSAVYDDLEAS